MSSGEPLRVVLCWHMHQPQYQDLVTGEHVLPWTYLHAIKDYVDMAVHLESQPGAAAVVNFSPALIEQIRDYSAQISAWQRTGQPIRDRVLALLTPEGMPQDAVLRTDALRACLKANRERLIERFAPYKLLATLATDLLDKDAAAYASPQFVRDLAVWYHLAWFGETVRLGDPRAQELMTKEKDYSTEDCRQLLEIIGDILSGLLPRYRRLMGSGQVELSVTPWGHPIVPLMFDFDAAREAQPELALPAEPEYPGGDDRARWHVARAIQSFVETFGVRPRGCWPAEGAVSERALALFDEFGFDWVATGEAVLRNSLAASGADSVQHSAGLLHRPYRLPGGRVRCFFRHDAWSDLIGFTYSKWHGDDAAANLVDHLEHLAKLFEDEPGHVVAIVLDGENAWEYYPFNAYYFLKALYEKLSDHPRLRLTTFSSCLAEGAKDGELKKLVAGSWVHGNLSTWIGHPAKNHAWDLLCEAKRAFDRVVVEGSLSEEEQIAAERQLGVCEGSDWCWWFGDDNPSEAVETFDQLYRRHLGNLYRMLEEETPASLAEPIAHGGGTPEAGGVMKRSA
ncbi:MAG TPA: glycoside hydrolase family 57 protein [Steroidobacteraceae bacterium]|nr:glycoside hydrolase family 57 protein [Steroidobacteraceae bacterium]